MLGGKLYPVSQALPRDGSWAAVQQGPGILGASGGEGDAAGFGGVIKRVLVSEYKAVVGGGD